MNKITSNRYSIRAARFSDAGEISQLIVSSVEEFVSYEYSEEGAKTMLASMSEKAIQDNLLHSYEYLVAEVGRVIIGVLAIKDKNHIFHCFVDKNYHNNGIAQALWEFWLKENPVESLTTDNMTVNSSKYAVAFYRKLGFESREELIEKNGITCYPMDLKLSRFA